MRRFLPFALRALSFDLAVVLILLVGYLLYSPIPIAPRAWDPPEAPELTGIYEVNTALDTVDRLMGGIAKGPEGVAVDSEGRIYGGTLDGMILRCNADGENIEYFAHTKGRPLGMNFDAQGNLIVADAKRGLLSIDPQGVVSVLAAEHLGTPFHFADDVDIGADGTIYFSDASNKFGIDEVMNSVMEHAPNGRLLTYTPETDKVETLLGDLYFANGVAVSPDQSFVLVNETNAYRVTRRWLKGPRAGDSEVFIDNLPGFPDGISTGENGIYWVAIYSPRSSLLDALLPHPFLRKLVARLPESMNPAPEDYGMVLGFNEKGILIHNLQGPSGSFAPITTVEEHEGKLYLGSLLDDAIGVIPVPTHQR